jgi:RimJ/RimL family protein N-acetyltransferase
VAAEHERVRSDRLLLRRPSAADAAFVLALLVDPRTTVHNPSDGLSELGHAQTLLQRWDAQWAAGLGYWIVEERSGAVIGVCGVKAVDLPSGPAWNLLYRFAPDAWGHGYAREAAAEALRAAAEVDLRRPVVARVRPANTASARVAAAIGLERRPDLDVAGDDGPDEVWATPRSTRTA